MDGSIVLHKVSQKVTIESEEKIPEDEVTTNTINNLLVPEVLEAGVEYKFEAYCTVNKPLKVRLVLRDTITNKMWSNLDVYDVSPEMSEIAESSIKPYWNTPVGSHYKWYAYLMDGSVVLHKVSQKVTIESEEKINESFHTLTDQNDLSKKNTVSLFPNPVINNANFEIFVNNPAKVVVDIYNQSGAIVSTKNSNVSSGKNQIVISSEDFAPGLYYYNVIINNSTYKGKFLKQ
jgi:hypothetical protein